jgi:hypothetical protein
VRQLLSHEEMGDRKPSQFLRHLKGLAPDVPDNFLRTIWASRLPPHVQAILAGQTKGSLDSASHLADRICEVTPLPTTAAVTASKPEDSAGLRERTDELTRLVASLQGSQDRSRSHSRHRRNRTPHVSPAQHDTCGYHWRFGDKARKCTPPCSKHQENLTSGR